MKKFKVRIFYSSFCSYEVEAENEDEAVLKARNLEIDQNEIMLQLEPFKEADEAEILESAKDD
ncbi:hypothetical protein [Campylobacter troglodytis]|uniref:hypothetical protein n=1 Tax=Campylobacter troglodytis TaxID=654363 RepID=UPI00115BF9AF|nr:hypothetical protein [Campylobacter troglodytis]TQR61572.1 hypothetical protein DMC01_00965 [Campylobacter troglodytis]